LGIPHRRKGSTKSPPLESTVTPKKQRLSDVDIISVSSSDSDTSGAEESEPPHVSRRIQQQPASKLPRRHDVPLTALRPSPINRQNRTSKDQVPDINFDDYYNQKPGDRQDVETFIAPKEDVEKDEDGLPVLTSRDLDNMSAEQRADMFAAAR
jgi:hypothetical protein